MGMTCHKVPKARQGDEESRYFLGRDVRGKIETPIRRRALANFLISFGAPADLNAKESRVQNYCGRDHAYNFEGFAVAIPQFHSGSSEPSGSIVK